MADEDKPEDIELQQSADSKGHEGADAPVPRLDEAQETVDVIAKNVQARAAEIEDVLAEASAPVALPKAQPEPEPAFQIPPRPSAPDPMLDFDAEEDEPNLQISVGGEKVRITTAHPLIEDIAEQLNKSRQFTVYSIAGLCIALLGAVLFYILMAAQLSSKVGEIDGLLSAVAKRTLQMTKGIEAFSALEARLEESLANQLMQREMLAANEIAMVGMSEMVGSVPSQITSHTSESLGQAEQTLIAELKAVQRENAALKQELGRIGQGLEAQTAELAALRTMRRELTGLKSTLQQVEGTVGDLYVIERARVAKQVLGPKEELVRQQN